MSKLESLKEKKSDLREVFKALLYFVILILTGITTASYKVLIHQIPAYVIIVVGIGLVIVFLVVLYIVRIWQVMQEINEEIENV